LNSQRTQVLPEQMGYKAAGVVGDKAAGLANAHTGALSIDEPGAEDCKFSASFGHWSDGLTDASLSVA
jgi:hypothetical protein